MVTRWTHLTRAVLPALAPIHRWPIRWDHCFMRVLLDNALGAPWPSLVPRPAIRHLTSAQLAAALALAEQVVLDPALLPELNKRSLAWRRAAGV